MPKPACCLCGSCSVCRKRANDHRYYLNNRDQVREKVKEYLVANRESINEKKREFRRSQSTNSEWVERSNEQKRQWAIKSGYDSNRDRQKVRARRTVQRLVAQGDLIRGDCEVCGEPDAQAHHEDYSRPLDVKWFCAQHHSDHHRGKI